MQGFCLRLLRFMHLTRHCHGPRHLPGLWDLAGLELDRMQMQGGLFQISTSPEPEAITLVSRSSRGCNLF